MKAFFKDSDKIIINSMDYTEALVGKQFLDNLDGKMIKAEQRNDINDDFDGLVLSIVDIPTSDTESDPEPTPEPTDEPAEEDPEVQG